MKKSQNYWIKNALGGWLIMLPALILFVFFVWEPLIEVIRMSLYHAQGYKLTEFVGLQNYFSLFRQPDFVPAWRNTGLYIVFSLLIGFLVPLFIATMITESPILKSLTRVAVYFPNVLPGIAIVLIWRFLFTPGNSGVLNQMLHVFGIPPFAWLSAKGWAIPLIVLTMTWKSAGATALIYMAGITGINAEMIEAATIDGAGPVRRTISIVLPNLRGLIETMLILQIISVFQVLYEPLVMTNGGPNGASQSVMMLVYHFAFDMYDYPRAAAMSVLICIALSLITVLYFAVTRRVNRRAY